MTVPLRLFYVEQHPRIRPASGRLTVGARVLGEARACLHICVTCGHPDEPRPGAVLHERVAALMEPAEPFRLAAVKCLARCGEGCSLAVTAPGKWGYLMSRLAPENAADILTYARAYAVHETGALLPSRRPESLKNTVIGRIPALETAS